MAAHVEDVVRKFIANCTGCSFAAALANKKNGMLWVTFDRAPSAQTPGLLTQVLDTFADQSKVVVFVFPSLRSAEDVARLVGFFGENDRWEVSEPKWSSHPRDNAALVWMKWRNPMGLFSSAMGFAPLGSMPAHRRAPYVSLAVWPGGRENTIAEPKGKTLGFLDVALPLKLRSKRAYDVATKTTRKRVALLKTIPAEGAAHYNVTFCIPRDVRAVALR